MDSLTQMALGATAAAVCVPRTDKRRAALIGAALGTLPDLDVLIRYADPIDNFVKHRGFSHSLFVLFPFSLVLWLIGKRISIKVKKAPYHWLAAIALTLLTHPLLDAHTVYGTQLLWPLDSPPVMWSTIFIIDPAYTLPLLMAFLAALCAPQWKGIQTALTLGILLSSSYLTWSWVAKSMVGDKVDEHIRLKSIASKDYFTVPTPFNTLLWRIVITTTEGYYEGFYSLKSPNDNIEFEFIALNPEAQNIEAGENSKRKLQWFSHGFIKTEIINNQLVVRDLRMGTEPDYVFSFSIAEKYNGNWRTIAPIKAGVRYDKERLKEIFKLL